jgi:Copper type II ascorbate-dependent monooxygenase, C-terminal domain
MEYRYRTSFVTTAMLCLIGACGSETPATLPVAVTAGTTGALPTLPAAGTTATTPPVAVGQAGTPGTAGAPARPMTTAGGAAIPPVMGAAGGGAVPAGGSVPCDVSKVLVAKCQSCHGAMPIAGAPMPLMTQADFHKPAPTQPTMKVWQVVQTRIHDTMRPMPPPPATMLPAPEMNALDSWIKAGALAGAPTEAACDTKPPVVEGNTDGSRGSLVEIPGEKCYEFKVHQSTTSVDDVPYEVGGDGEHYEQFYYNVPWPKGTVATAYGTKIDNAAVLHHWLLFSTLEPETHGFHKTAPLPTLIGTDPVLLAGWAVGGPNLVAPKEVGFELPDPGRTINVQWHFYNSTGKPQKDASSVQICTVPIAQRKHVGGVTWLGTEDLGGNVWFGGAGMPPRKESTFTTTCVPGRRGIGPNDSIHIIGFEPHMHRIGKRMTTSVKKPDGTLQMIFDKPFVFGSETHYYQDYELKPGEQLVTSCTFNNDTDRGVPFGESSDTEMCYQFTFAYPAHALSNGAPSLLGVPDTCWSGTTMK